MLDEKISLFIDTNAFLQMRDLKDIPWRKLFPKASEITLMVAPGVISELDDHKTSTNERRRSRARAALSIIDKAAALNDHSIAIREGGPVIVRVKLFPGGKFDWDAHPILDHTSIDDQIVAAAILSGANAKVFSADRGPRIRARLSGLHAPDPLDDWMLPDEKTDDQRKISELKTELIRALSTKPSIVAEFEGINEETRALAIYIPILKQLDFDQVETLSNAYFAAHPMKRLARSTAHLRYNIQTGPSDGDIDRYQRKYGEFQIAVRDYFSTLHDKVTEQSHTIGVPYGVTNDSSVAAQGLRIEFELDGDGWLVADRDDMSNLHTKMGPPVPPKVPRGMADLFPTSAGLDALIQDRDRDPVLFYWKDRPGINRKTSAKQCEDFRATRAYRSEALVYVFSEVPTELRLTLRVDAHNGTAPVTRSAEISIEVREMGWHAPRVLDLLPEQIREAIESLSI